MDAKIDPKASCSNADKLVSPKEQNKIVSELSIGRARSKYRYCISKVWYDNWKCYARQEQGDKKRKKEPGPGPVFLEDDEENAVFLDENVWMKFVEWHGIDPGHSLMRRQSGSDFVKFCVCKLGPGPSMADIEKTLDVMEDIGYLEVQMRRIFDVPESRKSRLWLKRETEDQFSQLLYREETLDKQEEVFDIDDHVYILAIEVADGDRSWPTGHPGEPIGTLEKYRHITKLINGKRSWQTDLESNVQSVIAKMSGELKDLQEKVVRAAALSVEKKEQSLEDKIENVKSEEQELQSKEEELVQKSKLIEKEESRLEKERKALQEEKEKLKDDRRRLNEEMQHMEKTNEKAQGRVELDVGGMKYVTSVSTLTKDQNSMLGAMFSGRHKVQKESDGSIFIDRDGTHFRHILNYLRDGAFRPGTLPEDRSFVSELLTEAEYYQITGLIMYLQQTCGVAKKQPLQCSTSSASGERKSKRVKTSR